MSAMVGRWRATYSPGDWLVLGGPTSLVLLEPPGDDVSALLDALWEHVVSSASMPDLATRMAAFKIDTMPTFAAFFWTEQGMRSLVRGDVSVVDVASGDIVATGEGIQTWTEIGLAHLSQVRVDTPQQPAGPLRLPLVVGAVRASTVQLDASDQARVSSPQGVESVESEQAAVAEVDAEAPLDGQATEMMIDPFGELPSEPLPIHESPPTPREPVGGQQPEPERQPEPELEPEPEPVPEPEPAASEPNPFDDVEDADTELMVLPPAPPPTEPIEPTAQLSADSMIMAVACQYGHDSPQNATLCRICGSPIAPQGPRLVTRPCSPSSGPRTARPPTWTAPCWSAGPRPAIDPQPARRG